MTSSTSDRSSILLDAGLALSSEHSLPSVLQRIVELAVEVTGARYGALGVLATDGSLRDFLTCGVTQAERDAIGPLPVGRGILGVLIDDARVLRIPDMGKDPRSAGFPANHPAMRSFLGGPVMAYGRVFGNIYLADKQAADAFDDDDERALRVLAAQAGVAIENARLYEEAAVRNRRLEALREIATVILEGADPERVLDLVADRARELAVADTGTIVIPGDEPGTLRIAAAKGAHASDLLGTVMPADLSVSGEVIRTGKSVVIADASADGRVHQPVVRLGVFGPVTFVPIRAGDRSFGTLMVTRHNGGRPFEDADVELLETFADQASVGFEYARVREGLRRLAVLEDRERIAKELHDGAIQSLFAVGMGLQGTAMLSGDPGIESRIEDAVVEIDRVISDLRSYIFGLRPGILAERQLDQALRVLAEELAGRNGVTTVVDVEEQAAVELGPLAGDVLQLARESLSNVSRHAAAATCRVSLRSVDGAVVLEIDDDGRGFDVARRKGAGNGLSNLLDRSAALGGSLELTSEPGAGTTVRVTIPVTPARAR